MRARGVEMRLGYVSAHFPKCHEARWVRSRGVETCLSERFGVSVGCRVQFVSNEASLITP